MKLDTAINHANEIARRLRNLSGIIGTPDAAWEALRIKRAWVFGSTAKGKSHPNDLDVLLEMFPVGRRNMVGKPRYQRPGVTGNAKKCHKYEKIFGIIAPISTTETALRRLRTGMKMVRFHDIDIDGNLAFPRIMIYPRNDISLKESVANDH